ncbi:MAG: hypothetical protein K6T78_14815 [Alicyclobacillus sp.]|nr:hypothetical protein [Alicyclobacillus sp.]
MAYETMLLAHRGWSTQYPENTCLAFEQALGLPIEGLEFDVQLTADEVPVVIHDATVDRTTDGSGEVSAFLYREIRKLNAAANFVDKGMAEQPIPRLVEVLNSIERIRPESYFNVELKVYEGDGRALVDRVVPLIQQCSRGDNVLYSSFHHGCLEYLKSHFPEVEIGLLYREPAPEPWYAAKHLGAYSVNLKYGLATDDMIASCREHGMRVCVWTVDDPNQISQFIRQQVEILITNAPDLALDVRSRLRASEMHS